MLDKIVFLDKDEKDYHAMNLEDISNIIVTEEIEGKNSLEATIIRDKYNNYIIDIIQNTEYIKIYNKKHKQYETYKILNIKRKHNGGSLIETFYCINYNYKNYYRKLVNFVYTEEQENDKIKIPKLTLSQILQNVLYREGYYDFRSMIGSIAESNSLLMKEYIEKDMLEVLEDLQSTYNKYLIITQDGKINFYDEVGQDTTTTFHVGNNATIKEITQEIDKQEYKVVVSRGTDDLKYIGKTSDFKIGDDMYLNDDGEETDTTALQNKTNNKLEELKEDKVNITLSINTLESEDIAGTFNVYDTIGIRDEFLSPNIIYQKVKKLSYNPFDLTRDVEIELINEQEDFVKFIKQKLISNQKKEENKGKKRDKKITYMEKVLKSIRDTLGTTL